MCLIALAYNAHPRFPLIVAANRDEFRDRPVEPACFWREAPQLLAGRDLQAGGTWMGISLAGRFAAITNYRDLRRGATNGPSRGLLVREALEGSISTDGTERYEGFNLIHGNLDALHYHNNIQPAEELLAPGVHGLSNHFLNTPWPKVERAKEAMRKLLADRDEMLVKGLFELLADGEPAPEEHLPDTGLPRDLERAVSSIHIGGEGYGTRCSTVLLVSSDGRVRFEERSFPGPTVLEEFVISG